MESAAGPLLVTERLELWLPARGDMAQMLALLSDPHTTRYVGQGASRAGQFARFSRNAGSWLLYGYGGFMLRLQRQRDVIGQCGIFHSWRGLGEDFDDQPEAGWIVRQDHCGLGYAREAMEATLAWFDSEHGPQQVFCMIDPANGPSLRLAERLGFTAMRDTSWAGGDPVRLLARARSGDPPLYGLS